MGVDQVFGAIADINQATTTAVEGTAQIQVSLDALEKLCDETEAAMERYRT